MLAERLEKEGLYCRLVSSKENQIFRLLDILWTVARFNGKNIHIDVFSGPAFRIADWASRIAAWKSKRILLTLHGGRLQEFAGQEMSRISNVFKRANHIQTPSLFLQEYFRGLGFDVAYLPNAINQEQFPYLKKIGGAKLLWVRAFTEIYNPAIAIQTLLEVKKKHPEATLTMVGPDRGLMPKIRELIKSKGLEQAVRITGAIPNSMLIKFFHAHDVYINTTSYESFGVALVEAASSGIPIVSTSVGEIPYIWKDGETALLVKELDPVAFSNAICSIIEDPALGEKLSVQARLKAESFDWNAIGPAWRALVKPA